MRGTGFFNPMKMSYKRESKIKLEAAIDYNKSMSTIDWSDIIETQLENTWYGTENY